MLAVVLIWRQTGGRNEQSGVFVLKKRVDCRNLAVLLADDVFTAGTTLAAAASVLREAGPENICVLSPGGR